MSEEPTVQETTERMVFRVLSDSQRGRFFRVDLLANNGAGQCECPDFRIRRQPNLDAGEAIWTKRTSCKHSRRAAWHVLRQTLPAMAEMENAPRKRSSP